MKLKQLEGLLGDLEQFSDPKVELEQYPTGPHIASRMIYTAENTFDDINGKIVADFGCGCGTLGIASALLGAQHVVGVDIDPQSLDSALTNVTDMEVDINLVQCDVKSIRWRERLVETIVMNPPFGTRKKGVDMDFLSTALKIASQAVYSLHKTTTREHVKRAALRDFNAKIAEVLCEAMEIVYENVVEVAGRSKEPLLKIVREKGKHVIRIRSTLLAITSIQNITLRMALACMRISFELCKTLFRSSPTTTMQIACKNEIKVIEDGKFRASWYNRLLRTFSLLRFDVPRLYKFHKKKEVDVAVDLWRFVPQSPH